MLSLLSNLSRTLERTWARRLANLLLPVLILVLVADVSRHRLPPAEATTAAGPGLALYLEGQFRVRDDGAAATAAARYALDELKRRYKILGILCRDSRDRSIYVRDRETREDRVCRIGDQLSGARIVDIQPDFALFDRAGARLRLELFSGLPDTAPAGVAAHP